MNSAAQDALPPASHLADEVQRDSDIWFEDGNVVVIAQNTAFRFHKGVLSHHSQVFRDLFLVPQPSASEASQIDVLDGCPVVHVSDTSFDFKELLRALYGGVSYLYPGRSAAFPVLAALGRLAHKYQLDQLLEAVIQRLKGSFTTRLDVWDRSGGFDPTLSPMRLYRNHAVEALNLFRLLDRPEMMPMAVYGCCQLAPKALVRGVQRADGVSLECLSPDDLEWCLAVKDTLMRQTVRLLANLCLALEARIASAADDGRCPSPFTCVVAMKAWLDDWRVCPEEHMDENPLDEYYAVKLDQVEEDEALCAACAGAVRDRLSELRHEIWMNLPDFLGLQIAGTLSGHSATHFEFHVLLLPRVRISPTRNGQGAWSSSITAATHSTMSEPAGEDDGQDGRLPGNVKGSTADSEEKIPFRLWFDDGSVVLVAERTAFRVHASLLSRHSPPLKKLFAIPRSSKGEHMMDGCPVFHLSDTAADLDHFLQLIYDTPRYALDSTPLSPALTTYGAGATPKSLPLPCNPLREVVKPTFARLSAYIRLGYKYEIFSLVDDALRKGERDVPFTFSENPAADAIDTVNLARMVGKPSLLPLALYL
ncbi:hypothetical protein V8D89_002220, partial [Ganoderma adspersum]